MPRVGLVLLTWDDAENLKGCLETLAETEESFDLVVVDNGSTDETLPLIYRVALPRVGTHLLKYPDLSLAPALNLGFGHFLRRPFIDYVGWVHPDMEFPNPDWLGILVRAMDADPTIVKLGAQEEGDQNQGWRKGNSQCYLVRRTALEQVGLFDERFEKCGGAEDWEINVRLARLGQVMICPDAVIRHKAMATRSRHDNREAGAHNLRLYRQLTSYDREVIPDWPCE